MLDNSSLQETNSTPVTHSRPQTAIGLSIERRFALHVTEYEQRDVVVNFKTGETINCRVPKAWSDNAVNILMSKYAVRAGVPDHLGGVNGREVDAERIFDRLVAGWRAAAIEHGYWTADDPNLTTFCAEIKAMLEQQRAAPNSPQWFNTGVQVMYGIQAGSDGHYYATVDAHGTATGHACSDSLAHPQISACFIQSVDDKLVGDGGIMDLWTREARLFKHGSGSGANYSALRGKGEKLSRGGMSSGLLSFLRVGDRSAGAIKSGGTCLAPWQRVYTARGPVPVKELADSGEDFIVVSYDPPAGRYKAKTARAWLAGHKQVVKVTTDKGEFCVTHDHPVRLSCGNVRRAGDLAAGNSLFRCSIDNDAGYIRVHLRNGAKGKNRLHRLVAADVLGHDLTGLVVHHIDGDKQNNTPNNLEIITQSEHAGGHNRELIVENAHVFQQRRFSHVGTSNGMHADSAFWQDERKVEAFRKSQSAALTRSGRALTMQQASSRQRMLNTAFEVLNAGLSIETFDDYIAGRKQVVGRIPSIRQTRDLIQSRFGSYDKFVAAVSANNHRVVSVEIVGDTDVYDVEVDCPTPDDKSPESGHNFVIWSDDSHIGSGIVVFNTRRSARMVIVDDDHPDVEEFVGWKTREDAKIRALHAAGIGDPKSFEDEATETVSGQNANNSVSVSDAFMRAVEDDGSWTLTRRTDGAAHKTLPARELWQQITEAAWTCADPGLQFRDTINEWHTCKADGDIRGSNPCCLVQNTLVHTERGYIRIDSLAVMFDRGESLPRVWSHVDGKAVLRQCLRAWKAGDAKELRIIETKNGLTIRCTPEHRFLTASGEYVEAQHLHDAELIGDKVEHVSGFVYCVPGESAAVYDIEVEDTHNFMVTDDPKLPPVVVHNSEYVFLDDTACNLASINLAKSHAALYPEQRHFDWDGYAHACRLWTIVLDISVSMAGYPTAEIARRSMLYRTLGLGYAALGELLVMLGLGYGTHEGRERAAELTSLMTAVAYMTSTELAEKLGAFPRFNANREHVLTVLGKHRNAAGETTRALWNVVIERAQRFGVRNAQVSLLAPTGCLVGNSLVLTERGLVRLSSLGNPHGEQWQDLGVQVRTNDGSHSATKFFVNGLERVMDVKTARGYSVSGTTTHRIKVVNAEGQLEWRYLADIKQGDMVALLTQGLVGKPSTVQLPALPDAYWTAEHHSAPDIMTAELAELVGYFMGDGSHHAKGLRLCVSPEDLDVVDRLAYLADSLFALKIGVEKTECHNVYINSTRLTFWWEACGFRKRAQCEGKGHTPFIPNAILHSNDPAIYAAFLRGLYEADATVTAGCPTLSSVNENLVRDVQTMLLTLGIPSSAYVSAPSDSRFGSRPIHVLRVLNRRAAALFGDKIGFIGRRKQGNVAAGDVCRLRCDYIPFTKADRDRLYPDTSPMKQRINTALSRRDRVIARSLAEKIVEETGDSDIQTRLAFFYDEVESAELGAEEFTYDISVPGPHAYIANGMVSHNTIGIQMDCETTGIEPYYSDTVVKQLAGGGYMKLVAARFSEALTRQLKVQHFDDCMRRAFTIEGGTIREYEWIEPPRALADVLVCADDLSPQQHVAMMAATQPFLSGAISKCVTGETLIATERGIIPIADFYRGESPDSFRTEKLSLASEQGPQKTADFYYGGEQPVLRLKLGDGRTICGTPNHRVKVGSQDGYDWKRLDEIAPGDFVALRLGYETWAGAEADLSCFTPSAMYGCQKHVQFPVAMTPKLARLLGYYTADGNMTAYSVRITKNDLPLLDEMNKLFVELFGIEGSVATDTRNGVTSLVVNSKALCEFFRWVGADGLAPTKVIPWAVLQSPKESVFAFVRGLWLDGYVSLPNKTVAISLASRQLIEQLQVIFDNSGVRTVIGKRVNKEYERDYPCLYFNGPAIRQFHELVTLDQSYKQDALNQLVTGLTDHKVWSDVVPCFRMEMQEAITQAHATRDFRNVMNKRTQHVSRQTAQEVYERFELNELAPIFAHNIHFVQVRSIDDDYAEVYDFHVPDTHTFLGNSIVNHNTVNMSSDATVDEVAEMYSLAWHSGLKSIAIYRDGCKPTQPLQGRKPKPGVQTYATREAAEDALQASTFAKSTPFDFGVAIREHDNGRVTLTYNGKSIETDKNAGAIADALGQFVPRDNTPLARGQRVDLPETLDVGVRVRVSLSGHTFHLLLTEYSDGSLAEIFVTASRTGSAIAGWVNAWAKTASLALQHGTPLAALVDAWRGEQFEPTGFHDGRPVLSPIDAFARVIEARYLTEQDSVRQTQTFTFATPEPKPHKVTGNACSSCGSFNLRPSGACYVCKRCGSTTGCS